jgi:endonuclease/exonuclease/phosphatase family metal-dependent hydrolase
LSNRKLFARPRAATIALIAAGVAAFAVPTIAQAAPPEGRVKVMSRNIYLGADLGPAIEAETQNELAFAAQGIWNDVHATLPEKRAKLQAKEIATAKPDLVGLQEVAIWRGDYSAPAQDGPVTPATTVEFDYLQSLMDELKKQGAKYKVVRQQKEFDAEIPLSGGLTADNPGDGRLTMRDVVLARRDAGVTTKFDYSQRFENPLVIEDIGGVSGFDVRVDRGFVAMDANVRGTEFRFVNTHLEAFDNTAKLLQAEELVQGLPAQHGPANPDGVDTPVVLVGDLNSDNEIVEDEGDTPQHQADELPYAAIVDAGLEERSFDGPEEDAIDDDLYSCCFGAELIDEPPPSALEDIDHTVDHVMVSDDDQGAGVDPNQNDIELVKSFQTGNDPAEFARFGRWAADHLGVVSVLQFPTDD